MGRSGFPNASQTFRYTDIVRPLREPSGRTCCIGLGLLFAMSCRGESTEEQVFCPRRRQWYEVEYAGGVVGTGHVMLEPTGGRRVDVALRMVIGPPSAGVVLQLARRGTCAGGIARARFGGGYPDSSPVRVLGATLEALHATESSELQ